MRKVTVISELRKELAVSMHGFLLWFSKILKRHPRFCFVLMIACMLSSAVLCFTFFRIPRNSPGLQARAKAPFGNASSRIDSTWVRLLESLEMQQELKLLLKKNPDSLSTADSLALKLFIIRMEHLRAINKH